VIGSRSKRRTLIALLIASSVSVAEETPGTKLPDSLEHEFPSFSEFDGCCEFEVSRNNDNETISPFAYFDAASSLIFYVESNGRHVTAISTMGAVIWHKNPFDDAHLCPYRVSKPVIVSLEPNDEYSLIVTFNSSQFGSLSKSTGEFRFLGQN
jgi:hypothetical protein